MEVIFYDTRVRADYHTMLVKDKVVEYEDVPLNTPNKVAEMVNDVVSLNVLGEEHCYMIAFNTKNRVLGLFLVAKGTVNQNILGIREVFMRALLVGAVQIILIHNHPSKDCNPSREDLLVTKRFKDAGALLNIELIDHIIVGGDSFFSCEEENIL